jgi:amidase
VRSVISGILQAEKLEAIMYPTASRRPPLISAPAEVPGGSSASGSNLANLSGFPEAIVPAGFTTDDLPVGMSLLGPAFSESRLLALAYSFEQATKVRRLPKHTPLRPGDSIAVP